MVEKVAVTPREGIKVRHEDGRHVQPGDRVPLNNYYRRTIASGDLEIFDPSKIAPEPAAALTPDQQLKAALKNLVPGNSDHFGEDGKPSLNHLTDLLGRRVTRKDVDQALKEMEN